ncbi:hypothetical protein D3C80_1730630 [compost metagenome]
MAADMSGAAGTASYGRNRIRMAVCRVWTAAVDCSGLYEGIPRRNNAKYSRLHADLVSRAVYRIVFFMCRCTSQAVP